MFRSYFSSLMSSLFSTSIVPYRDVLVEHAHDHAQVSFVAHCESTVRHFVCTPMSLEFIALKSVGFENAMINI